MNIIQINNLTKHFKVLNRHEGLLGAAKDLFSQDYKIVKAVDGISMQIAEGETIGFVGPNGAGKSTTIKMMTGVLEPSGGEININGYIPYKERKKYVQNIGVVFGQRTQLWWELPVIESFKILKEIYRIDKKVYDENMATFDELVNLKSLYTTPVRFMSLGQRMLCDIAASFLHNPKIIFLDEPTIGLDVSIKSKIRTVIKGLNEQKNTTILLTTHDISDIEALCKRIIIIDKGSIIYDDELSEINKMFGAYRTLKIDMGIPPQDLEEKIRAAFPCKSPIHVEKQDDGWLSVTINQDEVTLMNVLNFVMSNYPVKDVKIEEIKTESIIKKIYEGELK
ncbi:ABC transporter ATP-binding protein [Acetivibrio cellulolyticus]|uniref:ABC transporter ATP-binding protein n=1 Tax=Acetivibrio cellulolyticus TaxID=35830 RepID=UPI0001E2D091|nr:ATP-binding cassette domain-containing protein [Acetivibrio cellulolyticus]